MYSVFEQLLKAAGITTAEFCAESGISQSTISNWKKRGNLISGENAKIIAEFFDVSIDYLYTGIDKTRKAEKRFANESLKKASDFAAKTPDGLKSAVLELNASNMQRLTLYAEKLAELQSMELQKIADSARNVPMKRKQRTARVALSKRKNAAKE